MTAKAKKKVSPGNGSEPVAVQEQNPFGLTGPVIDDETGTKSFSQHDMMLLDLMQHKVVNATQAVRLKKHEADDFQRNANQKLASMQSIKVHLEGVAREHQDRLRELQQAISKKYNVDLSKVTYDDETGRITEPPMVEDMEPPPDTADAAETQPAV